MDILIGTVGGLFDGEGRHLLDGPIAHVTRDGGSWWTVGPAGLFRNGELLAAPPPGVTLHCVAVGHRNVWVGADSARLLQLQGDELVEDEPFAAAPGRDSWHTPWGGPPDVRSLTVDPDGRLYVNVHVGGILRRDDHGYTPTVDIAADVHQVVAHPRRRRVVAATARGLAVSDEDEGFTFLTDGLAHTYCRAVAVEGDTVVVSSSRGPRGGEAGVHASTGADIELRPCTALPEVEGNIDTHGIRLWEGSILVGNGSTVWQSDDGGRSWQAALEALPPVTALA